MNAPTNVVGIREVAPAAPKPRARTKSPAPAAAARAERKAAVKANAQEVQAQRWSAGLLGPVDIHFSQIMVAIRNSTAANDTTVFS
jgi:hypothetical protein